MSPAVAVRERPIIYTGESVRQILADAKTQTRRVMKPQPIGLTGLGHLMFATGPEDYEAPTESQLLARCPYGQPGDRIWVRETCRLEFSSAREAYKVAYKAGGETDWGADVGTEWTETAKWSPIRGTGQQCTAWRPSIHMPRWASRLTLEITEVRVQRIQEIGPGDCEAEGIRLPVAPSEKHPGMGIPLLCLTGPLKPSDFCPRHPREWALADYWRFEYANLWDTLNAKRGHGWSVNPHVWCLTFRRVSAPGDQTP